LRHGSVDPLKRSAVKFWRTAEQGLRLQRTKPAAPVARQPSIDRRPVQTPNAGHYFRAFTFLHLPHRAFAHCFQSFVIQLARIVFTHAKSESSGPCLVKKEDLQHGDLLAKKIERICWRLWHGRPQGALDLIDELLEELETPKRQIQLTAVYIKKLTGVLRELDTYVFGQFNSIINYAAARRSGEPISTAQTESAVQRFCIVG
jgi:hypothetical protein